MNRRDFLRKATIATAVGLSVVTPVGALARAPLKISPYKVSTEVGDYVLTLGAHGVEGITPGQQVLLPEGIKQWDGYLLETGNIEYLEYRNRFGDFVEFLKEYGFYEKLIPRLVEKKVSILFGDIPVSIGISSAVAAGRSLVDFAALVGGAFTAIGKDSKTMSRREFGKRALGTLVGGWGLSGLGKNMITVLSPELVRQSWTKQLRKAVSFSELIHPEDINLNARNAAIAKKLLHYSREFTKERGYRPTIGVAMGGGHEFISEYLKRGEKYCMDVLNIYPEDVLKKIFGNDNYEEYFPIMTEIVPKEVGQSYGVRIVVDPELRKKVGSLEKEGGFTSLERRG